MLTSNLLPPQEKKEIRREKLRLVVRLFAYLTVAVFIVGVIFLLPVFLSLALEKGELERSLAVEEEAARELEIQNLKSRISAVKSGLSRIEAHILDSSRASDIIAEIFSGSSSGINVQNIIVGKDGILSISGVAGTRRELLNFEKKLRDSGKLQELTAPVPVKEFEVNFALRGKLKPMYMLNP